MAWPSLSTNFGRSRSAPGCPGGASHPASRFIGCGASRTPVRVRCCGTPPARRFRGTATRGASTSTCSSARSATSGANTPPARTWSTRPDRSTRSRARKVAWCSWSGSGPTHSSTTSAEMSGGWQAALELGFAAEHGATRLARRAHRGPLVVQRPFLPEGPGVCHVYVLHPPGGLVGGDELTLDVDVATGAHALVTTPAASKVYRTNGAAVRQVQRLRVAGGATLEWLPQEAIIYDGARASLETRVELG